MVFIYRCFIAGLCDFTITFYLYIFLSMDFLSEINYMYVSMYVKWQHNCWTEGKIRAQKYRSSYQITKHAHTKSPAIPETLRKYQNSESKSSEDQIHMSLKVFRNNKSSTERLL